MRRYMHLMCMYSYSTAAAFLTKPGSPSVIKHTRWLGNFQSNFTFRFGSSLSSSHANEDGSGHSFPFETIRQAIEYGTRILMDYEVTEPDISALHLLSHAMNEVADNAGRGDEQFKVKFSELGSMPRRALVADESKLYLEFLERRKNHEPIQYILGEWDFMDFTLVCRKPTLCPRPETEELVEFICKDIDTNIKLFDQRTMRVLDVGCGTGAIGLAIARKYPNASVIGIDKCDKAVALSNENARLLGLSHDSYTACISTADKFHVMNDQKFHFVVSNPPYIPLNDMTALSKDVIDHEDYDALCGGTDGLDVVRDIINQLPNWLADDGGRSCWMEVDTSHPKIIEKIISNDMKVDNVIFDGYKQDFCGRDRFIKLSVLT